MPSELDHLFICTSSGAPEADHLVRLGLIEGAPNRHPGQGTACRRFFFRNAYLELLWVVDPAEAQGDPARRTGLWERWSRRGRGASPFGVCLRPTQRGVDDVPFPAWGYRPPYLPDPLVIQMGANSAVVTEPLLFFMSFGRRPDSGEPSRRQPLEHAAGLRAITRARFTGPRDWGNSIAMSAVEHECLCLRFVPGDEDLVEVGFDEEKEGRSADFRPNLPLIMRW
jgi:hypothetical protein